MTTRVQALIDAARAVVELGFLDLPETRRLAAAVQAFDKKKGRPGDSCPTIKRVTDIP